MKPEDIEKALDNILDLMLKLTARLEGIEKGGPGSGCRGHGCGRPTGHAGEHEPRVPRSGVRPSAVNPSRHEIDYTEEKPLTNRPRSGVRPIAVKPRD